ncbi:MAG: DUF4836 family protein [Bacteroidales bacterium]
MKNVISVFILSLATVMLITSCSQQPEHINTIPGDAFTVMHFNPDPCNRDDIIKQLKENEDYQDMMKELREESETMANILEDFIKEPSSIGVDMEAEMFGFAAPLEDNDQFYFGVSMLMKNPDKFEEVLKKMAEEMEADISIESEGDFKKVALPVGIVIWNKKQLLVLGSNGDFDALTKGKYLMTQEPKSSITANKDFMQFYENCLDANIWVTSNIDNLSTEMSMMGKMAGVKLTDNYAHIHFDWDKKEGQFMMISKLRVNDEIKNMDFEDIQRIAIETGAMNNLTALFGR